MTLLTKDEILAYRPPVVETHDVPEWGGQVCIRPISGDARDTWDLFHSNHRDPETNLLREGTRQVRATLVALSLCDEQGRALDFTPEEVAALGEANGAVLDRLFDACLVLSRLDKKAVEDAKKNSGPAPSCASGTC